MTAIITDLAAFAAELCLYISTAGFIASRFGDIRPGLVYFLSALAAGGASRLLQKKKRAVRLIPVLILALMFIGAKTSASVAVGVPICMYTVCRVWTGNWAVSHGRVASTLKIGLIAYAVIVVIAALSGGVQVLSGSSLSFFTAFLMLCVADMKLLRSASAGPVKPKFYALTAGTVLGIGVLGLIMCSEPVSALMRDGIALIYDYVLVPLLLCVGILLAAVPSLIILGGLKLISMLSGGYDMENIPITEEEYTDRLFETAREIVTTAWIEKLGIAIAIAAVLTVCIIVIKKLVGRRHTAIAVGPEGNILRSTADGNGPKGEAKKQSRAVSSVRNTYRRYLQLLESVNIPPQKDASDRICERSEERFGEEQPRIMREVWLPVRYSGAGGTRGDVRAARKALALMRAMSHTVTHRESRKRDDDNN